MKTGISSGTSIAQVFLAAVLCLLAFSAPPAFAALDFTTGVTRTEAGVPVINRSPSIKPPNREAPKAKLRPKLRPGTQEAVVEPEAEVEVPQPVETAAVDPAQITPEVEEQPVAPQTVVEEPTAPLAQPHPSHATQKPKLRPTSEGLAEPELVNPELVPTETQTATEPTEPEAPELLTEQAETAQEEAPTELTVETTAYADPALKGKFPKLRPSGFSDKVEPSLLSRAFPGHRGKTPKRRPATILAAAKPKPEPEPITLPTPDPALTKLQIEQDIREREEAERLAGLASATRLAVRVSKVPNKKSSRFGSVVSRTKANIKKASLTGTTLSPEEPSGSNSTKGSTFGKGKISLVGVFGTSSQRRALIRTSSGRYVKVKRGQNVSGWRVSAIGESTVKITRGVRSRTLRLP